MNIHDRIERLEKELAELKAEAVKTWGPQGGTWFVNASGRVFQGCTTTKYRENGVERQTQELAERTSVMMRKFNRLLAYHDEFCPEHDPAGKLDGDTNNYHVYYEKGEWKVGSWRFINVNGVYFPQETAKELCRKLNSGEVVL